MSEYLRKILGAGKTPLIKSNPIAALTADAGPDVPGGEGANKGYWRKQLKDPRTKQFIEMGGGIVCTVTLPDGTVVKGTGKFKGNSSPGVAIIEFKGIKGIPDGKYNVPHENILGQADGIIPAKDLDRVLDKADGVIDDPKNILPPGTEMIDGTPEKPALKKAIEGEEALSIIKGEAALVAKEGGRFPIARGPQDIKTAAKRQYAKVFEVLKKENPELVKDFDSADAFWAHIEKNVAIDTSQRWMDSVAEIPELTKATNRIYAREILGMDPDGLITFYRNSINHHDNPDKAAAGYISLDQRMAWNYNSNKEQMGHDGRYIVKVKPDEVMGLIGYSKVPDEYGVVVGPDVTSQEGRYERVGDLAWTPLNPLMDPNKTQMGAGGDSWFRHFRPASSFDFPVMDSKPFEDGESWSDFYKQFNLQKGDIPSKYDELHGEGAFDQDFPESRGVPNYARFAKNAFTEKDGKYAFDPLYLSTEFPMNSATSMEPNKGDELDLGLKFLSTIQELSGKTFMVHRSHNKNDSRLKDVKIEEPEAAVETPAVEAPEVETRSSDWANDEAWLQRATAEYEENRNLIGGDSTAATAFVPGDNLASDLEGSIVKAVPSKDPKKNFDVEVTKKTGLNAVSLYQRTVVIADINGVKVPFYLSTGQGGKKDVASGKWYPFFGASGGWLNKASGKYINNYYGSPELRAQAEWLDKNVGDIRNDTSIEIPVIRDQDTPEFLARLNADVHPIPNGEDEKVDILIKANVADIVKRVRMRPKDMFADPALSWDSLGGPTEGRGESELLDNLVDGDFLDVGSIKDGDVPRNFDLDELPEEQAKSLRYYKGSGFRFMNNFLRYGQEDMPEDQAALLRTEMSNLDELIDTYGDVYTETTVFRGMFDQEKILETDVSLVEVLESVKPGDTISDPGYTATTTKRAVAINEFGLGAGMPDDVDLKASQEQWRSTALFAIKLPEGSKALGLPLDSNYGAEAEVVLPRDAKLKINAIRRVAQVDADGEENGNYNYFVDAETVPAEAPQEEAATNKQVNALIRLYQEVEDGDAKDVIFKAVKDKENLTAARAKELLEADYSPKPVPEVPKEMAERFFNPKYGAGDSKTDVAMLPIDEVEKYIVQDRAGKDSWGASSDATIKKITEELENGGSIRDPLVIDFDDENNWGALAEGHHRLIAARQAGLKYVPVRILRAQGRNVSFKNKGKGAPLTFSAGPDKFGYIPGAAHASLFDQFADKKPETKPKKLGNEPNVKASDEKVDMLISKVSRLKIEDVEKLKEAIKNGTLTNELADELSSKAPGSLDILNDPVMLKAILKKHVGDSVTADDMQDLVDGNRTKDGYGFYHATNRELKVGDIIRPTESFAASASHGGLSFDIKKEMSPEEWEKKRAFAKLDGGQGVKGLSFYIARAAEMKGEPDGMGYFYRVKPVGTLSAFPSLEPEWVTDEGWEIVHVVGRASINDTRVDDRIHFDEDTDTLWHDNPEEYNSPDYGKRKTDDIIDTSSGDMPVLSQIIKTESTNEVGKGTTTLSADFDYVSYRKFDSSYLDEDEIEAITEYRAGGYAQINELLRTARLRNSEVPEEKVQKWIDTLDSAIDTWGSPMRGSIRNVVYRGQVLSGGSAPEVGEADMTEVINRLSPGMILEDRGFLSASTSPTIAYKEFGPGLYERGAVKGDTVFWAINVPEDVKGLFSPENIGIAAEKEVIFHRNSKLAIKGVRKIVGQDGHARYFIEADMLAPDSELVPKTEEESSKSSPEVAELLAEFEKNRVEPPVKVESAESGPSVWGRIKLRDIKDSFKYLADDPEFSDLLKQYSGSDEAIDKLKEILTEKGFFNKNKVKNSYFKFTSAAEKEYRKIDPNLDTETGIAPAAPYGDIEDSGLGTIGYIDSQSVMTKLGDGWIFNKDASARDAAKKRISEEGFTSPVILIYDKDTQTFTLKSPEADSDRLLAARDLRRSTPVVVETDGLSSNPRFFGGLYTPKDLQATEEIKEDWPDLSGIPDLPTPSRSKEEKDAIDAYQKWGYLDLKTHMETPYGHPDKSQEEREELDKLVENLDKLTSTEPIPDGTIMYRGVYLGSDPEWYDYFSALEAGDRLLMPTRFSSTTLDPVIADEYAVPSRGAKIAPEDMKSVVIKITAGEGATGAAFENDKTVFSREKEVLLPLMANIEITKVEKDSDGVIRVEGIYSKTPKIEKQIEEGGGFTLTPDSEDVAPEATEENPYATKSEGPIRNERDALYRAGMAQEAKSKPIVSRLMELLNLNVSEVTDIQDQINKGDWKHENGSYSEAKTGAFSKYNKILVEFGEYEPSSSTYLKNGETGLATWLSDELGMDIKDLEIKQRTSKSGSTRPTQKFGSPKTFNSSLRPLLNGADYYYVDTDALAFYIYPNEDLKKAVLEQIKNGDLNWTGGKAGKSGMSVAVDKPKYAFKLVTSPDRTTRTWVFDGTEENKKEFKEYIKKTYKQDQGSEVDETKVLDNLLKDKEDFDANNLPKLPVENEVPDSEEKRKTALLYTQVGVDLNDFLRNPETSPDSDEDGPYGKVDYKKIAKDLDNLLEEHGTITERKVVFRGAIDTSENKDAYVNLRSGDIVDDPGFLSTSNDPETTREYFSKAYNKKISSPSTYSATSFWTIEVPPGSKALSVAKVSQHNFEQEVVLPRNTKLKINEIRKVNQTNDDGTLKIGSYNYFIDATVQPQTQKDWDAQTGLKTTTAKPIKGRKPGFENWNSQILKLIAAKQETDPVKGNTVQYKFIKEAGFNGKPQILSQADFDALEGQTMYRAVGSTDQVKHFKESEVQFAGAGSFGNGTYASNLKETTEYYAGDTNGDPDIIASRTMEMKLLPDSNVVTFDDAFYEDEETNMSTYIKNLCDEFINQYRESGADPAEVQEAEWKLHNGSDWTNIAIMKGVDAIRFKVPFHSRDEYYTIILNRGKVAINGKS